MTTHLADPSEEELAAIVEEWKSLDPLDHPPAADLEDLNHRATRSELEAEHVAMPLLHRRHFLLAILQRLDGADRIAQLRRFFGSSAGKARHAPLMVDSLPLDRIPRPLEALLAHIGSG